MAERNENGTITLTPEELAELTAEAAKNAIESKGVRNAMAYAALRAIGNVANVTETLGLPLPDNNETVAYQDFINAANLIIDNFAKTTGNTLDSVSATASSAANGVAAADTKIANITTRLDNDGVDGLPQFKQDTEDRLESVENDVMGLSGWNAFVISAGTSTVTQSIQKSSIGLWVASNRNSDTDWEAVTEQCKNYFGRAINTGMKYKTIWGSAAGNVFNLPEVNVIYLCQCYTKDNDGTLRTGGIGIKWTGVETQIMNLSAYNTTQYFDETIYPIVRI